MKIKSSLLVLSTLGAFSVASAQTGYGADHPTNLPGSSSVPPTSTGTSDTNRESSGAIRQKEDRTGIYNPSDTEAQPQPQKAKKGTQPMPSDSKDKGSDVNNTSDPLSGPGPKGP